MFDFSAFKNKHYWTLLIPFILITLAIFIFAPQAYTVQFAIIIVIMFWVVYYVWGRYDSQNNKQD